MCCIRQKLEASSWTFLTSTNWRKKMRDELMNCKINSKGRLVKLTSTRRSKSKKPSSKRGLASKLRTNLPLNDFCGEDTQTSSPSWIIENSTSSNQLTSVPLRMEPIMTEESTALSIKLALSRIQAELEQVDFLAQAQT